MSVLIRPEQIELRPTAAAGGGGERDRDEDGLGGQIVKSGYHGHDAVLHVQLALEHAERPLVVRTLGDLRPGDGADVRLSVRGPVLVWPR